MTMKISLFWATILLVFVAAVALNSRLPTSRTVLAAYEQGKSVDSMKFNYHEFVNPDGTVDEVYFQAILYHEMIHSFKALGIVDQDVPTAAAMGYYYEWHLVGEVREDDKQERFDLGAASSSPATDVMEIIMRYRSRDTDVETIESYSDGAELAGLLSGLFGNDAESTLIYVMAISMGLHHESAMAALKNKNLSSVLFGFRTGRYFVIDEERLNSDLALLPEEAIEGAVTYIRAVLEAYDIGLVPQKDVEIDIR